MKKLGIIAFLIMAFTTVTTLTMPNPAQQSPAKFDSYDQMMRYFKGLKIPRGQLHDGSIPSSGTN